MTKKTCKEMSKPNMFAPVNYLMKEMVEDVVTNSIEYRCRVPVASDLRSDIWTMFRFLMTEAIVGVCRDQTRKRRHPGRGSR